jgi:hypothetical protein
MSEFPATTTRFLAGGQFWYGNYGFMFKRRAGGGVRRNPSVNCAGTTSLYNTYISGAGVGPNSVFARRAKKLRASAQCC